MSEYNIFFRFLPRPSLVLSLHVSIDSNTSPYLRVECAVLREHAEQVTVTRNWVLSLRALQVVNAVFTRPLTWLR